MGAEQNFASGLDYRCDGRSGQSRRTASGRTRLPRFRRRPLPEKRAQLDAVARQKQLPLESIELDVGDDASVQKRCITCWRRPARSTY